MAAINSFIKQFRDITRNDVGLSGDAQRIEQLTWMLFLKMYDDREQVQSLLDDSYRSIVPAELQWHNWANTRNEKGLKGEELLNFVDMKLFPGLQNLPIPPNCPLEQSIIKDVFADIYNYIKDGVILRAVLALINEFDFSDHDNTHAFGTIYETILKNLQSAGSYGEFYTPRALTDFIAAHVDLKIGDKVADFACGTGGFLTSAYACLQKQVSSSQDQQTISDALYGTEKKPLPFLLCVTNMLLNNINLHITRGNSLTHKVSDYGPKDAFDVILMNPPYGGNEKGDVLSNFPSNQRSAETADLFIILIMNRLRKVTGRAAVIIPDGFMFGGGNKAEIKKQLLSDFNLHTVVRLPKSVFAPYTGITTNVLFFNAGGPTEKTWFYRVDLPEGYKNFSKTKPMLLEHLDDLDAWWNNRGEIEDASGFFKAKAYTREELEQNGFNLDLCGFFQVEEELLPPDELIADFKAKLQQDNSAIDAFLSKITAMLNDKEA